MDKDTMNFEANFSVLDRYGTDVTKEEYVTDPAIGRDQQIKDLILVLLTPEKSAILIGKPGIGKTAIVEGLAYRIQKNDVPEALQGYTILNIKTASLLGTMPSGESKVQKMIDELKTKEKMILFIDEIHMLIGSTETSSLDFANIFKEGLGRGSIKVIGATTTEEYEKYILRDKAFTRRFQKIDVPEPNREETIKIMMGTLPKFEKQTGRKMKYTPFIQERIMSFIVDITSEYKRIFSLGSRYPDVCLTLLKQAFSYTVYDNRPYMDIFDIRKAIENSKNIYPDVIRKELPNFDKMFNDILLEEKGEKPVDEWRQDGTLTRNEIENENNNAETEVVKNQDKLKKDIEEVQNNISRLESVPEMIDRIELQNGKPISNIIDSKGKRKLAKVGSASVSTGLKEKINKTTNSDVLDDMLLSSDMNVLRNEQKPEKKITNYVVTDEIRPDVDDRFLLRRPIRSNVEEEEIDQRIPASKYRTGNQRNKKGVERDMWNNNMPERQDINNQNFDRYQNYFHPENQQNQDPENIRRMDMLMGGSNIANQNDMYNQMPNQGFDPMNNQMYGQMNGQVPNQMNNQMYGYGQMNGQMPNQMNNQMYGMNGQMPNQMNNQMYGQMNGPMPSPMPNQMYGMNGQMPNQMPNPGFNQIPSPMPNPGFDPMNNQLLNQQDSANAFNNQINNQQLNNNNNNGNGNESFFGAPMYDETPKVDSQTESLFGAPMYSEETVEKTDDNTVDIYGQLLADNMSLKNGEIVNEFPTFEKLNNLSNIATGSDLNSNKPPIDLMANPNMPANNNNNRNWTFIDNGQQNNQQADNNSSFFQKNILDDVPKAKEENNISLNENIATPTNNKDYYEDMKSGDFVNFSDLNSGKVKEEDTNKYMGVQTEENKPQFDLNLESGSEEDNKFDDFYE